MNREEELRRLTEKYWRDKWDVETYIQKLLPEELDYLKEHERLTAPPAEILVQLVGFSWEPLLISVCAYKPEKVVLVLNEWYGDQEGKARGVKYQELIAKLNELNLIDSTPELLPQPLEEVKDKPEDVFRFLKAHILPFVNAGKRVVVDITGAKKSMVSGAYLFSSYTNVSVSYVDYDEYNNDFGKPYGYTCKPGELENPIERFKLREWDKVRQLYKQYAFRSARALIEEIKESTKSFFDDDELHSIDFLMDWLDFYRLWDEGDYSGSWYKWAENNSFRAIRSKISDAYCPTAVKKLGTLWPDKKDFKKLKSGFEAIEGSGNVEKSIYLEDEEILVYAYDELEKIKRLIRYHEDYRSALLRAAGLNEILLKARVVRSWVRNTFVIDVKGERLTREDIKNHSEYGRYLPKVDDKGVLDAGATYLHMALRWEEGKGDKYAIKLNKLEELNYPIAHRSVDGPVLVDFWKPLKKKYKGFGLPDDVFNIRNKAIHFCLSIPKEIAEVAVAMAEKNVEDFQEEWTNNTLTDSNYEAMSWNELCAACDITFLSRRGNKNE
jgi:hypothetical protein